MANESTLIGAVIDLRERDLEKRVQELMGAGIGWVQIYIPPDIATNQIRWLKYLPVEKLVHIAHETHFFNFPNGPTKLNKICVDKAVEAADFLGAKFLVVHPGYITEEQWNARGKDALNVDRKFDALTGYLLQKVHGRYNILVENMPKWNNGNRYLFTFPLDPFYYDMVQSGFGFCLDLANAALTTNCFPYFLFGPPQGIFASEEYARMMLSGDDEIFSDHLSAMHRQQRQYEYEKDLTGFLSLRPQLIHTRGIGNWSFFRNPRKMGELNDLQFQTVIPYCTANQVPIIVESLGNQQIEDIKYVQNQLSGFRKSGN